MEKRSDWDINALMLKIQQAYEKHRMLVAWAKERDPIRKAVESIADGLPAQRYRPISVLGVGGSGIVIRLSDSVFPTVDNALKFPRPVEGKVALIAEMLGKEMKYLADLRHPGIVKILFCETLKDIEGYGQLPFYIMDVVDGLPSGDFLTKPETTGIQLFALIKETVDVIHYLHTHVSSAFVHLDIKPDNIVADHSGRAVMIDLGTCKKVGVDNNATTVACTASFAHPHLARRLQQDPTDERRSKGQLSRSDIDPRWDLWSFGLTLLAWLGFDPADGSMRPKPIIEKLPVYSQKYLVLLAARLLTDNIPSWLVKRVGLSENFLKSIPIRNAEELRGVLSRINGQLGPIAAIPELATATTGTIQAAPGLHVPNTPRLKATLAHRLLRRLNSITQLGVVSQIYPSAKHARREHSLGTYANCGRVIRALYDDPLSPLFRQVITEKDLCEVLLCALLHDIGQYPLAHDLEEIDKKLFDHEQLTQAMIKGVWSKKKKGSKEIKFEPLDKIIGLWGTTQERLIAILSAKATNTSADPKDKLLRSIISGPIDADKLDYLFRDARHTDVPYPYGVDIDRIIRCLTTVIIDKVDGGVVDVPAVGVHAKGKVAAEFLTLARYAMFSQVYWHHAVRVQKAMLFRAVEALLSANSSSEAKLLDFQTQFIDMVSRLPESLYISEGLLLPTGIVAEGTDTFHNIGSNTDLVVTDAALLFWLRDRLTQMKLPEAGLIDGIVSREWYKRLWVVSRDMHDKRWDKLVLSWDQLDRMKRHKVALEFEKMLKKRIIEKAVSVTSMAAETVKERIEQMTAAHEPWLLIDIPGGRPGSEISLYYVLESQGRRLRKDNRVVGDLQPSSVWSSYARNLREAAGKIRIFCHPDFAESLDASITWDIGIDDLQATLESLAT